VEERGGHRAHNVANRARKREIIAVGGWLWTCFKKNEGGKEAQGGKSGGILCLSTTSNAKTAMRIEGLAENIGLSKGRVDEYERLCQSRVKARRGRRASREDNPVRTGMSKARGDHLTQKKNYKKAFLKNAGKSCNRMEI